MGAFKHITIMILFIFTVTAKFPRVVWIYWETGESTVPPFYQLCLNRMKDVLVPQWDIRLISDSNLEYWLNIEEAKIIRDFKSYMKLPYRVQYKSDYVRLTFLEKFGGVWMDIGNILLENFEWLDKLIDNPHVINRIGKEPQVFQFSSGSPFTILPRLINGIEYQISPEGESWFIAAIPQARFIKDWRSTLAALFLGTIENYDSTIKRSKVKLGTLLYSELYLMVYQAEQIVLQVKQQELDAEGSLQLAIEYYKLWCINSHKGPFIVNPGVFLNREKQNVRVMTSYKFNEFVAQRSMPRYLIKVYGAQFAQMNYLVSGKDQQFKQHIDKVFTNTSIFGLDRIWPCLNYHILVKGSLIDKYLLASSMELVKGKVYEPEEVPYICRITDNDYIFIYTTWIVLATLIAFIFLYGTRNKQLPSSNLSTYQIINCKDEIDQPFAHNAKRERILAIILSILSCLGMSFQVFMWFTFYFPFNLSGFCSIILLIFCHNQVRAAPNLPSKQVPLIRLVYVLLTMVTMINTWDCMMNCFHDAPYFYESIAHEFLRMEYTIFKGCFFSICWVFLIELIFTKGLNVLH